MDVEAQKRAAASCAVAFVRSGMRHLAEDLRARGDVEVEERTEDRLLDGVDDIGLTLKKESAIAKFEDRRKQTQPRL